MASPYYMSNSGPSALSNSLSFFERLGVYDIVLPFLLVFTIVFAIFERTRILGTEQVDGTTYPKKSLNAMAAFVIAFLVIASSKMVSIINESLPKIVILLFLCVFFLLLVGIFYSEKEEVVLSGNWKIFFMVTLFIAIVFIFLHSIPTDSGEPVLYWIFNQLLYNFSSAAVSSIVLMVVVIGFMFYIVRDQKPAGSGGSGGKDHHH